MEVSSVWSIVSSIDVGSLILLRIPPVSISRSVIDIRQMYSTREFKLSAVHLFGECTTKAKGQGQEVKILYKGQSSNRIYAFVVFFIECKTLTVAVTQTHTV